MGVAERGDGVTAVQIEHLASVGARKIDAVTLHGFERQQRVHLVEMRVALLHQSLRRRHHNHPAAAAVKPAVSGKPSNRFAH